MQFKFVNTPLITATGAIWVFVAVVNLFTTAVMVRTAGYLVAFLPLITSVLGGILPVYYLTLYKRTYITIHKDYIRIHRGMDYKDKHIFFSEIEIIMERDNKLRIQRLNGQEIRIALDMLELKGVKAIKSTFEEKCESKILLFP